MASKSNALYRTLWRWHFYAGLFCIPFVITLSLTGAVYLFKPQIDSWAERDYQNLKIDGVRAAPSKHIAAAMEMFEGASFISYRLPQRETQAVLITVRHEGISRLVYVNPYTLEIVGTKQFDNQFIRIVRTLHGELLLGTAGSVLIELAGCWAIVLIITGLFLWWPRSASGLAGVIYPRIRQSKRIFLRDLHAVTGFWAAFFTLFLLVSGLPWSLVWGTAFKELRSIGKPAMEQSWQITSAQNTTAGNAHVPLTTALVEKVRELEFAAPVLISLDPKNESRWKVSSRHQNRPLRADAWLDVQTSELVKLKQFSDKNIIDRVVGYGIAAHEGQLFGWFNQLLGLLVAIALIVVSASGFILWRKRKPAGTLGAPPLPPNKRVGKVVFFTTLGVAIILPLLAISLVLLYILENLLFKKIDACNRWLGLER